MNRSETRAKVRKPKGKRSSKPTTKVVGSETTVERSA